MEYMFISCNEGCGEKGGTCSDPRGGNLPHCMNACTGAGNGLPSVIPGGDLQTMTYPPGIIYFISPAYASKLASRCR